MVASRGGSKTAAAQVQIKPHSFGIAHQPADSESEIIGASGLTSQELIFVHCYECCKERIQSCSQGLDLNRTFQWQKQMVVYIPLHGTMCRTRNVVVAISSRIITCLWPRYLERTVIFLSYLGCSHSQGKILFSVAREKIKQPKISDYCCFCSETQWNLSSLL